jgi:Zn-finger protein
LGKKCGGNFRYNEKGFKDCTNCSFPHRKDNYEKVIGRYGEIIDLVKHMDGFNEKQ